MYSKTSEQLNYRARVASHSTKGFRTGLVKVLPPAARPEEQVYQSVREQYLAGYEQETAILEEMASLNSQPATAAILRRSSELLATVRDLHARLTLLRGTTRSLGPKSFAETFYEIARAKLNGPAFDSVYAEAMQLLGRPCQEVCYKSGRSGERKYSLARALSKPRSAEASQLANRLFGPAGMIGHDEKPRIRVKAMSRPVPLE